MLRFSMHSKADIASSVFGTPFFRFRVLFAVNETITFLNLNLHLIYIHVHIHLQTDSQANLLWCGREHPKYQHLSDAMKMFLSSGRPFLRKLILGKGDPSELSSALVGNSVLLAQPSPGNIYDMLPPPPENMSDALSVIFTTSRSDVKRAKPLQIPRNLYLECAQLRRRICYAFADVSVGDASHFPEAGVPSEIGRGYINNNIFNNFMLIFMYNSNLFFHL